MSKKNILSIIILSILIGITIYLLQMQISDLKNTQIKSQQNISKFEKKINLELREEINILEDQIGDIIDLINLIDVDNNIEKNKEINSELREKINILENQVNIIKNKPKNSTAKIYDCSEEAIDKIIFSKKLYCAYEKSITEINNNIETTIYTMDKKYEFGAISDLINISPDGSILFFEYYPGDIPEVNAIDIKTKTLIYDKNQIYTRYIIWSPNEEYVIFAGGHHDMLHLKVASKNNIKSPVSVFDSITDFSNENSFYWKNDNVFVFDPNEKDCNEHAKEIYQEIGLNCEINEFKIEDYF